VQKNGAFLFLFFFFEILAAGDTFWEVTVANGEVPVREIIGAS